MRTRFNETQLGRFEDAALFERFTSKRCGHGLRHKKHVAHDSAESTASFHKSVQDSDQSANHNGAEIRKQAQFASQVTRAVQSAIDELDSDGWFSGYYVSSAIQPSGPNSLILRIQATRATELINPTELQDRLNSLMPAIRSRVAHEISRKAVPSLSFVILGFAQHQDNVIE